MTIDILFVDEENIKRGDREEAELISRLLKCQVTTPRTIEDARELLEQNQYSLLMIQPFSRLLTPHNPAVNLIRKAREKRIPVVISSAFSRGELMLHYGLVEETDYQRLLQKPYSIPRVGIPILRELLDTQPA